MMQTRNGENFSNGMLEHLRENSMTGKCHICACCKRILTQSGIWKEVESHLLKSPAYDLTTVVCLECLEKRFPHEYDALFPNQLGD